MQRPDWFDKFYLFLIDVAFSLLPQKKPSQEKIKSCKIVSHRGVRDGKTIFENTFKAFDPVVKEGVWGIEFDIRWTKDCVPVVFHDADCKRVFNKDIIIKDVTVSELQAACPEIPTLKDFIERYKNKCHLFPEIKEEVYSEPEKQNAILIEIFSGLAPCKDYHFLSLSKNMIDIITFLPNNTFVTVADTNAREISQLTIEENYGGFTSHYLLLTKKRIQAHHQANQLVGVGFITSKNNLYRELNRDVDWIFTNDAVKLLEICKS